MKFAWNTELTDLYGRTVVDEVGTPVTLGQLAVGALSKALVTNFDGAAKYSWTKVAEKIVCGDDIDVTEAALVKEKVGEHLTPVPVRRVWDLLEHPLVS